MARLTLKEGPQKSHSYAAIENHCPTQFRSTDQLYEYKTLEERLYETVTRVGLGTCTLNPIGEWICESGCEPGPMARIQEGRDKKNEAVSSKSRRSLIQFKFGLEADAIL